MTPDKLAEIGKRLYGPKWKHKLADALTRSPGAISNWLAGKTVPKTAAAKIEQLHAEHQGKDSK